MQRLKKVNPARPALRRDDEGGPLSRELTSVRLIRLVDFINRSASRAFTRVSGLSDFEWRTLAWVCEMPRLSINDLSALMHRDAGQVSRTVKKLVETGLLHRANRSGGPGVLITPTRRGRSAYDPLVRLAKQRNVGIIAGLSAEEVKTLGRCITVMTANAHAQLAHERQLQADADDTRG